MPNRERRTARAEAHMRRDLDIVARELRDARIRSGLTLREAGLGAGTSYGTILRAESGRDPSRVLLHLARHAAAVGLRIRLQAYPGDDPIRDAGQVALIGDFRLAVGDVGRWAFEVAIPHPYDQRALDAVLTLPAGRVGLEFYTRLSDAQAQLRSASIKKRDANLDVMIVVLRGTDRNRRAWREAGQAMADLFPGSARRVLADLRAARMPAEDAVVLISGRYR